MQMLNFADSLFYMKDDKRGGNKAHGKDNADCVQQAEIKNNSFLLKN
jgi:hypothetical protein